MRDKLGDENGAANIEESLFRRCLLAYGIFSIVMFVGVLPVGSALRRQFSPIRGELSIVATILAFGHVGNYIKPYLAQGLAGLIGLPKGLVLSFLVSCVLVTLLTILSVTSIRCVRRNLDCAVWKKAQLLVYPFFGLIFVHLSLALVPSVSFFGQKAFFSVMIYSAILLLYVVFRLRKARADWNDKEKVRKQ